MTARTDRAPSMLVVTTVAGTMGFLLPYLRHFGSQGWRVDGCARGLREYEPARGLFEHAYELPLTRSIRDLRAIGAGARELDTVLRRGYDIVHVHTPIAGFLVRLLVRRMPAETRPKVVYTAHGFHFHEGGHPVTNFAFLTAERVAGRWTDRLVVINEEDAEAALRHHIVPRSRLCHMAGIGVDTAWYSSAALPPGATDEAKRRIGLDPAQEYFITVGELSKRKRPDDVVRALGRMRDRSKALVLLGDGGRRAAVERAATEAGVADRVVLPGQVPDIRPLVAGALALIQASSREGLPRSMMEALSLGVPLVATDARGHDELVGSDRGLLVQVGAIDEMALAMDRIAAEPETRARMGESGRSEMIRRYEARLLIAEHERMYSELLAAG